MFPNFLVKHATRIVLDHYPIVLNTEGIMAGQQSKTRRRFRFETIWVKEEDCARVIREAWQWPENTSMGEKMKQTIDQLLQWHNKKFKGLRRDIDKHTKEL